MRAMRIVTVTCWLIAAAAFIGLAFWFLTGTVFGFRRDTGAFDWSRGFSIGGWETLTGPYEVAGVYSAGTDGVKSLNVDWIAGDVTIKPHDSNDIKITEFAQRELRDDERLVFDTSGDTLTIKYRKPGNVINMPQKKLEVLIPRQLSENLNALAVDSASGKQYISDIKADNLKTDSISGSIELTNITAGSLGINSASGSVRIASVQTSDLKVDNISGSVKISDSAAGKLNCDSASGSIEVNGDFEDVKLQTISGRITLRNPKPNSVLNADTSSGTLDFSGSFDKIDVDSISGSISIRSDVVPSAVKADSTSGGITIAIPEGDTVSVRHSTTSGRFSSDIPVTMQSRDAQFDLSTISGNIRIVTLG